MQGGCLVEESARVGQWGIKHPPVSHLRLALRDGQQGHQRRYDQKAGHKR